ncbi:MAG: hypothetical protein JXO22_04235, partial [Phycisphaerae bacterium]|nr:hypothetical protein [Phycisphaerae bacterium]
MSTNVTTASLVVHLVGPDLSPAHAPIICALRATPASKFRHLLVQVGTPLTGGGLRPDLQIAPARFGAGIFMRRLRHALRRAIRDLDPSQTTLHIWSPMAFKCVAGCWPELARAAVVEADDPTVLGQNLSCSPNAGRLLMNVATTAAADQLVT